jgi:hypothetical protein
VTLQTFSCPNCGGTLEYDGHGRTMKCAYCGTVAQVPEALWQPIEQAQSVQQWKKWIVIFLVLTVGLPTCLGLVGTLVGVGGAILGAIVPFVVSIFAR